MSLNKAAKSQKTHRERHQPKSREQFGLLEKKKDYKLRANDYNEKKEVLKSLRKKALNKNPDEFYFHMINSKLTENGHRELVSKKVKDAESEDQIKLLQTQDHKYISTRRLMEAKKIEKLRNTLHMLDSDSRSSKNTHTIFVDEESEKKSLDLAERFDTEKELLGRTFNRPKKADLDSEKAFTNLDVADEIEKQQYKSYKQLQQRIHREKQLSVAEEKMRMKKLLRDKKNKPSAIVKEETTSSAPVLVWKFERKR